MAIEIERKFLVRHTDFLKDSVGQRIVQGYVANTLDAAVRVRIRDDLAYLTIKGRGVGIVRQEFEYQIPLSDAEAMIAGMCVNAPIEKMRHCVHVGAHVWEVDVFEGANAGLVVAEIELASVDEDFERPAWLSDEVSEDSRYLNASLAERPFCNW